MQTRLSHALLRAGLSAAVLGGLTLASSDASADPTRLVAAAAMPEPLHIQEGDVIRPLTWQPPVEGYRLTGQFGDSGNWSSLHTGLDFAVGQGTPIHAITGGVVTEAVYDGSYGNKVVVTAEDGTEIWYCHMDTLEVATGQSLATGELLGHVGMTGNTTGPHVHVEVRPQGGEPVDPAAVLAENGVHL